MTRNWWWICFSSAPVGSDPACTRHRTLGRQRQLHDTIWTGAAWRAVMCQSATATFDNSQLTQSGYNPCACKRQLSDSFFKATFFKATCSGLHLTEGRAEVAYHVRGVPRAPEFSCGQSAPAGDPKTQGERSRGLVQCICKTAAITKRQLVSCMHDGVVVVAGTTMCEYVLSALVVRGSSALELRIPMLRYIMGSPCSKLHLSGPRYADQAHVKTTDGLCQHGSCLTAPASSGDRAMSIEASECSSVVGWMSC